MVKAPAGDRRLTPRSAAARKCTAGLLLGLFLCFAAGADDRALELPVAGLNVGIHLIAAQVATTPQQRSTGLMFRKAMSANEGMLFVFGESRQQCFWMMDTFIPLSAAFIADDGTIVNLADMQPHSPDWHCSARPVRFVLEVNQGWFAQRGIEAGAPIQGGPFGSPKEPRSDAL